MSVAIIIVLLAVVFVVRLRSRDERGTGASAMVRRFFQYLLQFGMVVVVAAGLSSLLARALQRDPLVLANQAELARGLSFTIVGIPILVALVLWTRRRMAADPHEVGSAGWAFYLALAQITSLAFVVYSAQEVAAWLLRIADFVPEALATLVVWTIAWAVHWRIDDATTPSGVVRDHRLVGAALGLWTASVGLAGMVAAALHGVLGSTGKELAAVPGHPFVRGAIGLAVGAIVWGIYWVRSVQQGPRNLHWHAYVMLVGVASGFIAAIVAASTVLYDVLVWYLGTPRSLDPITHFGGASDAAGVFVAGLLVWWYHRSVLAESRDTVRDEPRRVYEYLIAAIALIATAAGVSILIVAFLESLSAGEQLAGAGAGNTLILASTLIVVGAPVWLVFWRGIRNAVAHARATEVAAPTRRLYLYLLFGVVGVAAVIALLVAVYFFFEDIVQGVAGLGTVRRMRWGIGILVAAAVVAVYHWRVYAAEREVAVVRGHRRILLVAPEDAQLRHAIAERLDARVDLWRRAAVAGEELATIEQIATAVDAVDARDVLVLLESGNVQVIPAERD